MRALFFGSFDPFTNGHYDLLKQAENIFDRVIIAIVRNPLKKRRFTIDSCLNGIRLITDKRVIYTDDILPTSIADEYNCDYIIRGLRDVDDYIYEERIIKSEQLLNKDVKTIYFRTDNMISSTFVYELLRQGINVDKFLPYNAEVLEQCVEVL